MLTPWDLHFRPLQQLVSINFVQSDSFFPFLTLPDCSFIHLFVFFLFLLFPPFCTFALNRFFFCLFLFSIFSGSLSFVLFSLI